MSWSSQPAIYSVLSQRIDRTDSFSLELSYSVIRLPSSWVTRTTRSNLPRELIGSRLGDTFRLHEITPNEFNCFVLHFVRLPFVALLPSTAISRSQRLKHIVKVSDKESKSRIETTGAAGRPRGRTPHLVRNF